MAFLNEKFAISILVFSPHYIELLQICETYIVVVHKQKVKVAKGLLWHSGDLVRAELRHNVGSSAWQVRLELPPAGVGWRDGLAV